MNSRRHEFSHRFAKAGGLGVALLLAAASLAGGQGLSPLFRPAPPTAAADTRRPERGVIRVRRVVVDLASLRAAGLHRRPDAPRSSLLLNLFDDVAFTAELDRLEAALGGTVWVGRIPGIDLSGVTLSTVGEAVAGTVAMPGAVYSIRYAGRGVHEIAAIDQSQFSDGREAVPAERDIIDANVPAGANTPIAADVLGAL
ncbi:MAG: hypothetical protein EHM24_26195, partial [Acidobacteria bacterium]